MQRHPALRDLSSEHHVGLVLARRARRAAEEETAAARQLAWQDLTRRFRQELEPHFRREEDGLLPALRSAGQAALVDRTLAEHAALRGLIDEDKPEHLARFAELLKAHIHFEEKELFETAQAVLNPAQLAALAAGDSAAGD